MELKDAVRHLLHLEQQTREAKHAIAQEVLENNLREFIKIDWEALRRMAEPRKC